MTQDLLLSQRALQRQYFNPEGVKQILKAHGQETVDHGTHLWDLLVLELWHRTFIDGDEWLSQGERPRILEEQPMVG